jgi:hypothetical protein
MPEDQGTSAALAETIAAVAGLAVALVPGSAAIAGPLGMLLNTAAKLAEAHAQGMVTPEKLDAARQDTADVLTQLNALRAAP